MVHSIQSYSSHPTDRIIQQCHTEDSMRSHCGMIIGFLVSVDSLLLVRALGYQYLLKTELI